MTDATDVQKYGSLVCKTMATGIIQAANDVTNGASNKGDLVLTATNVGTLAQNTKATLHYDTIPTLTFTSTNGADTLISGLSDPTDSNGAGTKNYLDSLTPTNEHILTGATNNAIANAFIIGHTSSRSTISDGIGTRTNFDCTVENGQPVTSIGEFDFSLTDTVNEDDEKSRFRMRIVTLGNPLTGLYLSSEGDMTLNGPLIQGGKNTLPGGSDTTTGHTILPDELLQGIYVRTALTDGVLDTLPTGTSLAAKVPNITIGHSFGLLIRNETPTTASNFFILRITGNTGASILGDIAIRPNQTVRYTGIFTSTTAYVLYEQTQDLFSSTEVDVVNVAGNATDQYEVDAFINGIVERDCNGLSRSDALPSAAYIVALYNNFIVSSTFETVIANISTAGQDITLTDAGGGTVVGMSTIEAGKSIKYTGRFTAITPTPQYDFYSN